ncbi:MAG: glycoside hydrolase family 172 protein [Planctomycetota bacterium]
MARTMWMAAAIWAAGLIESTGAALLDPAGRVAAKETTEAEVLLASGKGLERVLSGSGAVRRLSVRLDAKSLRDALRSTVLVLECDGQRTVWCPVGDFFGSGVGLNPYEGWWRVVSRDGWMTCFWPMPFETACRVRLVNYGAQDVRAELRVAHGDWRWDERSMHFHATWRHQHPVPTRPFRDWNYVEVKGTGVYVGDTLAVMNPVPVWWGEGDEKIWVDGEAFPSHFGTGTEDDYGYAYGNTAFFEAPFHAQPHVDGPGNQGHTTVTRTRGLDAIPFDRSLRVDMEVWHWRDVQMAYAAATYWYARPGAACNRAPEPYQATRPIPGPPPPKRVEGALEGEELTIVEKTGGETEVQRIPAHGWSGGAHLWWRDGKPGDTLAVALPVAKAGRYKVVVRLTKSYDYAIVQFGLDGEKLGDPIDLYSPKPVAIEPIALGVRRLAAGQHKLTLAIAGIHPKAKPRHMAGLDYVKLVPPP